MGWHPKPFKNIFGGHKGISREEANALTESEITFWFDEIVKRLHWEDVPPEKLAQRKKGLHDSIYHVIRGKILAFSDIEHVKSWLKNTRESNINDLTQKMKQTEEQLKSKFKKA